MKISAQLIQEPTVFFSTPCSVSFCVVQVKHENFILISKNEDIDFLANYCRAGDTLTIEVQESLLLDSNAVFAEFSPESCLRFALLRNELGGRFKASSYCVGAVKSKSVSFFTKVGRVVSDLQWKIPRILKGA
ncbi:MAG TPA: hypothetical protein V6D33_09105 [Cyanophyceae cyanobacterium]